MKKSSILLALALFAASFANAQDVTVSSAVGQNIGAFINNNLVGSGVYVYNAKFNGVTGSIRAQWPQVGSFQANGFGGLAMDNGIVLTTGNVSMAAGPNDQTSGSAAVSSYYTDPEMAARGYTTSATSCATIDFDFVCLSNSVSFTYCFGSEEYNEYVYSNYNDVFVFLLTGPDPVTGEMVTRNIAMIPNSVDSLHPDGIPVAINTVNNGTTGSYPSNCEGCYSTFSGFYNNNDTCNNTYSSVPCADANHGVQYDGYTTKMMAAGNILPCASYHMHISVCNVSDQGYDSGVFLEGNSLTSPEIAMGLRRTTTDTVRRSTPLTVPLSMNNTGFEQANVRINFGGEAVSGIDYLFLSDNGMVINNGENIVVTTAANYFTIQPLPSANLTTPKTLDLYFASSLCEEHPELLVYDTMHFILAEDVTGPGDGIDGVADGVFNVYPNPASGSITLNAPSAINYVTIVDAAGREVYSAAAAGTNSLRIDISRLQPGLYTLNATTTEGVLSRPVVVR